MSTIEKLCTANGTFTQAKDIANTLIDHFVNVSSTNANDFDSSSFQFNLPSLSSSFYIQPTDEIEVLNVINDLKFSNSAGFDGVSNTLIKKIGSKIAKILSFIFNLSFEQGCFPVLLKKAHVLPIHKKGDKSCADNYRPISILPVFAKICEKLMKKRMLNYLNKFNILSDSQYGFRERRNTEDALSDVLNIVYSGINANKSVSALFLDIKKAFDTVDHNILLHQLRNVGFRGTSYNWLKSYLSERQSSVKLNNVISDERIICAGVPQGSVLGPILFLIFFDSILRTRLNGICMAFADDLAIIYSSSNRLRNEESMKDDLKLISVWFHQNKLSLSDKSKCIFFDPIKPFKHSKIVFHNPLCSSQPCNNVNCFEIEQVEQFKYLGVYLDRRLSFKAHVDFLSTEIQKTNRQLYMLRPICPDEVMVTLYHALVNSRLQYGLTCWGGCYQSILKKIEIQQKNSIRIICFKHFRTHSLPLFQKLKILPLRYVYIFKVLKIFFLRSGHRTVNAMQYSLRLGQRCLVPQPNKELFRRYQLFTAPNIYNKIPGVIKNQPNVSKFLKLLNDWLLSLDNVDHLLNPIGT